MDATPDLYRAAGRFDVDPVALMVALYLTVACQQARHSAISGRILRDASVVQTDALAWRTPLRLVIDRTAEALNRVATSGPITVQAAGGSESVLIDHAGMHVNGVRRIPDQAVPMEEPVNAGEADRLLMRWRVTSLLRDLAERLDRPAAAAVSYGDEDDRIIAAANRTQRAWTAGSVADLLRSQIAARAGDRAVVAADGELTYAALAGRTQRLADAFRAAGVVPGEVVAVDGSRTADLVPRLLALWQVGAAFLPVGGDHPRERVRRQMEIVGVRHTVGLPADFPAPVGCRPLPTTGESRCELTFQPAPDTVAYVMCTSGTSGDPKAVAVPHGALRNCLLSFADLLSAQRPAVAGLTSLTFDISLLELLLPLVTGGVLLLADESTQRDPVRIARWLRASGADVVQATPTTWRMLLPYLTDELARSAILAGGERLTADLARELSRRARCAYNVYGPTEATIWCTTWRLPRNAAEPVSIGAPVANTRVEVLDAAGHRMPVGGIGELCVGGDQLALCYLNDPDRTRERFIDHPNYGRLYRTGDLCAWRADGTLEYRGRMDNQVKVRGHRIELEEIEATAEGHPCVARAAAVLLERRPDGPSIVLYVQPAVGYPVDIASLDRHLRDHLPSAALPQRVVAVAAMPLTPNLKVDRRALQRLGWPSDPNLGGEGEA